MKKLEQLPPSKIMEQLENRIKELNTYLSNHREMENIGGQIRNRMLKQYQKKSTERINEKISAERKFLITTATLTNEEYAEKWKEIQYHGKGFEKESIEFKTTNGLRVRSKSEILIAETLEKEGITFRYEYPIKLERIVYPDFYCLNARTRKEYLWEHLGKLDDKEYIEHNMIKFKNYAKHGYILGDNLIITYETAAYPLNTTDILKKIEVFLK